MRKIMRTLKDHARKIMLFLGVTLGVASFFLPVGLAQSLDIIVTEVLDGGAGIQATTNEGYETPVKRTFRLSPNADLSAYGPVSNIKVGDRLKIEAEKNSYDQWEISRIEPYKKSS